MNVEVEIAKLRAMIKLRDEYISRTIVHHLASPEHAAVYLEQVAEIDAMIERGIEGNLSAQPVDGGSIREDDKRRPGAFKL